MAQAEFHCSIHSIAETLLTLLESFHEPVIPFALYSKALDSSHSFALCQEVRPLIIADASLTFSRSR